MGPTGRGAGGSAAGDALPRVAAAGGGCAAIHSWTRGTSAAKRPRVEGPRGRAVESNVAALARLAMPGK